MWIGERVVVLTPLSTIIKLYCGGQFYSIFLAVAIGTIAFKNGNSCCMTCGSRATHLLLRIET